MAVAGLGFAASPLWADPIISAYFMDDPVITSPVLNYGARSGSLEVLSYQPGPHPYFRGPEDPGTLRFLFGAGAIGETTDGGLYSTAVKGFALNTDLTLTPNQFDISSGWTATPNAVVPGLGHFSWVLSAPSAKDALMSSITGFDISGLGDQASFAHFVFPASPVGANSSSAWFAADIVPLYFPDTFHGRVPDITDFWASGSLGVAAQTPEPCALALAGLGAIGLIGRRALHENNTACGLTSCKAARTHCILDDLHRPMSGN
jgi:hypothetical protein